MNNTEQFLNGWFEGLIEPNQGFRNLVYESLIKLLNLLPIKEANKLSIFISKITESNEAKGYLSTKTILQKKVNDWKKEKEEEKENELKNQKLNDEEKRGIIQSYLKTLSIPDEINQEFIDLSQRDINNSEFDFKKYELNGTLIKTYKVPDLKELETLNEREIKSFESLIDKIEKIDSWNLKGTDIKNLNKYINFNFD